MHTMIIVAVGIVKADNIVMDVVTDELLVNMFLDTGMGSVPVLGTATGEEDGTSFSDCKVGE